MQKKPKNDLYFVQILANLVMETLSPELKNVISPRLKGKMHQRQRNWMLVSFLHIPCSAEVWVQLCYMTFTLCCRSLMQCTGKCCHRPADNTKHWWRPVRPRELHWMPDYAPTWTRSSHLKNTSAARYEVTKDPQQRFCHDCQKINSKSVLGTQGAPCAL